MGSLVLSQLKHRGGSEIEQRLPLSSWNQMGPVEVNLR